MCCGFFVNPYSWNQRWASDLPDRHEIKCVVLSPVSACRAAVKLGHIDWSAISTVFAVSIVIRDAKHNNLTAHASNDIDDIFGPATEDDKAKAKGKAKVGDDKRPKRKAKPRRRRITPIKPKRTKPQKAVEDTFDAVLDEQFDDQAETGSARGYMR